MNHRMNSALPGYLMISSKTDTNDLSELSEGALAELGPLLAAAQKTMSQELHAERVYIGRYGHSPGFPIHFHVIPIHDWVEAPFWNYTTCGARSQSLLANWGRDAICGEHE